MKKQATKVVAVRVTEKLCEMIQEYCEKDAHLNPSDFIRDAIREKIQKEAPQLYHKLFAHAEG